MSESLQSFKVGEKIKVGDKLGSQASKTPAKAVEAPPAKNTAGFPRVEALIDEYANAAQAKEVFGESIAQLEGLLAVEKQPKKKSDLARIKKAFEHAMSTLDYLFSVKNELAQAGVAAPAKARK
jgi:hypothetical protein